MTFTHAVQPVLRSYNGKADSRCLMLQLGPVTIWYSYSTPIAFEVTGFPRVVSENVWSRTTGKHLNLIDRDKKNRVDSRTFNALWSEQIAPVLWQASVRASKFTASKQYAPRRRRRIDRGLVPTIDRRTQ